MVLRESLLLHPVLSTPMPPLLSFELFLCSSLVAAADNDDDDDDYDYANEYHIYRQLLSFCCILKLIIDESARVNLKLRHLI